MANIEGHGGPLWNTAAEVGDRYTDLDTNRTYKCTAIYTTSAVKPNLSKVIYDWQQVITESGSGTGGTVEVTRESIREALGYIPPEYDSFQYQKYNDKLIHILDYYGGTAKLIMSPSSLENHSVTVCGKNLFNINGDIHTNLSTGEERPGYVTVENGVLTTELHSSGYHPNGQRLYNLKGKTVTFSAICISEDVNGYIGIYEDGNEAIFITGQEQLKIEGYVCKTENPIFGLTTAGETGGAQFTNIQVEIGDYMTDYDPYFETSVPISSSVETYDLPIYYGQTNIFNDCSASMTVMINLLQYNKRATTIELPASGWTGSGLLYSQTVNVPIVTENSQVELRPSPVQLQELLTSEISLTAANESGIVTVFAIGGKPISDYTMQIIISEVTI